MSTTGVYKAISDVMATLAKQGISKDRKNEQQGYKFRGIDDVYNALSSALVGAGLVILPSFTKRELVERTTAKGGAIFNVTVEGTFTFVCVADGSQHVAGPFYGEAMDTADKASNKAMSAAFKYMAMEVFCIPTEGDNDADATTHEVVAKGRDALSMIAKWAADWAAKFDEIADPVKLEAEWKACKQDCMKFGDGTLALNAVKPAYAKRYRALVPEKAAA